MGKTSLMTSTLSYFSFLRSFDQQLDFFSFAYSLGTFNLQIVIHTWWWIPSLLKKNCYCYAFGPSSFTPSIISSFTFLVSFLSMWIYCKLSSVVTFCVLFGVCRQSEIFLTFVFLCNFFFYRLFPIIKSFFTLNFFLIQIIFSIVNVYFSFSIIILKSDIVFLLWIS